MASAELRSTIDVPCASAIVPCSAIAPLITVLARIFFVVVIVLIFIFFK
jgi:hypothetical protein